MGADIVTHLGEQVELAAGALGIALLLGVALGVAAAYLPPLRAAILALAGIGRTLPSLAVLTLLLPWLGVGAKPAIVALAILGLPPILINVDLAIRGIPLPVLDAATGLGMSARQRFVRVIVPSALPVAFSGVRIAATEVIASATLATFIGGGGLGDDIVRGLQTDNIGVLVAGTVTVAALAASVEFLLSRVARRLEATA